MRPKKEFARTWLDRSKRSVAHMAEAENILYYKDNFVMLIAGI
jgi:hypothetical protein